MDQSCGSKNKRERLGFFVDEGECSPSTRQRHKQPKGASNPGERMTHSQDDGSSCIQKAPLVQTVFSLNSLQSVFSTFRGQKQAILESIGFCSLVQIQDHYQFCRQIAFWLLKNMDPTSGALMLKNNARLTLKDRDVHLVLGIPDHGRIVKRSATVTATALRRIASDLMLPPGAQVTLKHVEAILLRDYGESMSKEEEQAFMTAAVLYADTYFLAPKGSNAKLNNEMIEHLSDPEAIRQTNWSAYIIRHLDNLDFGVLSPRHALLPRFRDYPYMLLKELARLDQEDSRQTGQPLRR